MTDNTSNSSIWTPHKPRIFSTWWIKHHLADALLWLTAFCAVLMLSGVGGGLIVISFMTIIGIPFGILLWVSVPLLAFALPVRIFYTALRMALPRLFSIMIACLLSAGLFTVVDSVLKAGPDGASLAQSIVDQQSRWSHMDLPEERAIAFYVEGEQDGTPTCARLCRDLLKDGLATSITMMSSPTAPQIRYFSKSGDEECPVGTTQSRYRSSICIDEAPVMVPYVMFSLSPLPIPEGEENLHGVWTFTQKSGAFMQSRTVVQAYVQSKGGLMTPNSSGSFAENLSYMSETRVKEYSVFDVAGYTSRAPDRTGLPVSWDVAVRAALR